MRQQTFFIKSQRIITLVSQDIQSHSDSTVCVIYHKGSLKQCMTDMLRNNKILFTKTGVGPNLGSVL